MPIPIIGPPPLGHPPSMWRKLRAWDIEVYNRPFLNSFIINMFFQLV